MRMVAACPCLVDTPLVRSHVTRHTSHLSVMNHRRNAMNIGKDEPFKSEMGMRPLKASEVLFIIFS